MDIAEMFDAYGRQARLLPALLLLFPLFVTVAIWFPALYQTAAGLIGLAVACGVTVLFGHLSRERGRRQERLLFATWGGKPTTIWLRFRDANLDHHTKTRYGEFLQGKIRGWKAPSEDEEKRDPTGVDARYDTAVKWLLEYTRNRKRFPLVFKENISYGFRRNLFGLRSWGIALTILCATINLVALVKGYQTDGALSLPGVASALVSILALIGWLGVVGPGWVRDAGDAYARVLLASCEELQ